MGTSPVEIGPGLLTRREVEVAGMVAEGLTNREIAKRLFISERTVDGHLEHVREKLAVNTRAQIAAWVTRQAAPDLVAAPTTPVNRPALHWTRLRLYVWLAAALVIALVASAVVVRLMQPMGPVITTIAGTGSAGAEYPAGSYSGDNGPAVHAQLLRPSDVAAASDGTLYIADYGNSLVRKVDTDGIITTVAGGGLVPLTDGAHAKTVSLTFASNLAIDPQSRSLFVLAIRAGDLEVWMIQDSLMVFEVSLGPTSAGSLVQFRLPVGGLAVAKDGTLYIADRAESRIWKWARGSKPAQYAGTGQAGFSGEGSAAIDAELNWPIGLAVDPRSGDLYIADSGNNCIRKVDRSQRITTVVGVCGALSGDNGDGMLASQARLSFPYGVAVDRDGNLFIADTGNNRLREVAPSGRIVALAGTGPAGIGGDHGLAIQATLAGPEAVTIDPHTGDLLVADTGNQRIRRVSRLSP